MKTERRHELHTNALEKWLVEQRDRAQPYVLPIVGIAVSVAVIVLVYMFLSSRSSSNTAEGWSRYYDATYAASQGNTDPLLALVEDGSYQGTAVGYWSHFTLANYRYNRGVEFLFSDIARARGELDGAVSNYDAVAQQSEYKELATLAMLGLGRSYEARNELDRARSAYEKVVAESPDTPFAVEAKSRLDDLGKTSTQSFYDWFASRQPRRGPLTGDPGLPGTMPELGLDPAPSEDPGGSLFPPLESKEGSSTDDSALKDEPAKTEPDKDSPAEAAKTEPAKDEPKK